MQTALRDSALHLLNVRRSCRPRNKFATIAQLSPLNERHLIISLIEPQRASQSAFKCIFHQQDISNHE